MANDITSLTLNKDIDFLQKDFNSVIDAIITFGNVNYGPGTEANRLWTDFNQSSFSRTWAEIVAFIADVFFYYFDVQSTQAYLQTATLKSAVKDIAKQFGFQPATASSASGNVIFTFTAAGTISRGFKVSTGSGVTYFLTNDLTAGAAGEYTGTVLQGEIKNQSFSAKGLQNEEFDLTGPNLIIDDSAVNAADLSPILTVNGNTYTLVETFLKSNGTDSAPAIDSLGEIIGGGGRVFQVGERPGGNPYIRFGDGINGRKLLPGETVAITYRTGGGSKGNVAKGTVTTLINNVSFVSTVTNPSDFSGGADEQSIEQLRDLIPASLRTLERAVSRTDYSDLITSKFSEVSDASTEINNDDPGIDINIYVVPQGITITNITDNTLLLNRLNDYIDRRKMVTIQFQILDAFGITALISIEVFINNTSSKTTIRNAINTTLTNYFNLTTGGTDGSGISFQEQILLKDIYNLIDAIDGVDRVEIKQLTYSPRIQKNIQGLVTDYNTSNVDIFKNVEELEWLVAASGQETESSGSVIFANPEPTNFTYNSSDGKITYEVPVNLAGVAPGDLFRNGPGLFEIVDIQTVGDGAGAIEVFNVITRADEQGTQEIFTAETVPDINGSLAGAYFVMFDIAGTVAVWFNVNGTTPQPSSGANRLIEVIISTNDNANDVAAALQAAVDLDSEFSASVSGSPHVIQIVAPIPASIADSQYFLVYSANDATGYYVWFNKSGSATDPNVSGRVGIEVDISAAASSTDVAVAIAAALDANADFVAAVPGSNTFTVTNANNGPSSDPSDVDVGGTFTVTTFTVGVTGNVVTIINDEKLDAFDVSDGTVPTNFDFQITVQGVSPDTLGGAYFDISDDVGPVRIWFDVDNTSTAPSIPMGGRLIEVDISANDPANTVASALQSAVDADAKYSAGVSLNQVTITNASVGIRTNPTDGLIATDFTFTIITEGADPVTLDGTYFIIPDISGGIAFWFDVDDDGTPEPVHGQFRSVEITTVTTGMTDVQVAEEVEKALTATAPYLTALVESSKVTTVADASGSLNNTYFFLNAANDITEYYVWYNVSGGGVDPAISGKTGIEVAISTNDTANDVALATQLAIDFEVDFVATVISDEVTITNADSGAATDIDDGAVPNNTGFTFEVLQQGATFGVSRVGNAITITSNDKATLDDPDAADSGFTILVTQKGVAEDTDFLITAVDIVDSVVYIAEDRPVNPVAGINAGGSIRNGSTIYESFTVYRKLLATVTNLSIDSITDNNLDLSVKTGTGSPLAARILIDNNQVFVPGEFSTGEYFLVDGAGNIWEIEDNNSNTISTSITAVNDAAISTVSTGNYKIVKKLVGFQIVFNGGVFNVQYNSENTIYSAGAQFTQIGTIGDQFAISKEQTNQGKLGIAADIIAFNPTNGEVRLNNAPDLQGVSSGDTLIDSAGQTFSIVSVDNRALPQIIYADSNQNDYLILEDSGLGSQYAQGFQVSQTETYSIISFDLKREGNVIGNLIARIVLDDGTGLPDLAQLVAISNSVLVTTVNSSVFEKVVFSFTNPPLLTAGINYHLVLSGDVTYNATQQNNVLTFDNTGSITYSYNSISGVVEYDSDVDLSNVEAGNFFEDNDGTLFQVLAVSDDLNTVTLSAGLPVIVGANGNVKANDNILLAVDNLSPTFSSGELSRYNGVVWSNSTLGPDQFSVEHDAIFSLEGPKSLRIDSNLTPTLGEGATVSSRYYDDENQVSFIIGLSSGSITSATDVIATGRGTVGAIPNSKVDNFVFRTSRYADDIINLRANEIPQLTTDDITINIFGGID